MHQHSAKKPSGIAKPDRSGLLIHGAARYDWLVWLYTLGRESRLRARMLRHAALQPGETVLDVGCGTGTLALLAKTQVGVTGEVTGIDASAEMIARAREKAARQKADVRFDEGTMQALPIADKSVDVVLSTLMLHHVPRPAWPEAMREMRRVLKPDGRMLIVDFIKPDADQRGFMHHIHRHGFMRLDRVVAALEAAGFAIKATGDVGQNDLNFVLATPNGETVMTTAEQFSISTEEDHTNSHGHRHGHGLLVGVGLLLAALLIGLHLGAAAYLPQLFSSRMSTIFIVLVAAIIILKLGFLTLLHRAAGGFLERWLGARKSED